MLLGAVFVDNKHPLMNILMQPLALELRELYHNGLTFQPENSPKVTSKFVALMGSFDAPARATMTNMNQYNGYNACLSCYAKGTHLKPGKMVFPIEQSFGKQRTSDEIKIDMKYASETGNSSNGIKGFSPLIALPKFDICKGVVVEAMHAVFLGVVKQHTKILLTSSKAPYYIGKPNFLNIIDSVLLSIKPSSRRSRKPRSISTWSQWKASEWRNWLDYAPICLKNVLHEKYINHFALLSEAIHYLNNDSIHPNQLDRAEKLLKKYVKLFQAYFDMTNMSFNIHQLTHLVQTVRYWGPIWVHSAFVFESWNKKIMDYVTSFNAPVEQIATRFLMLKFIQTAILDNSISLEASDFIKKMLKTLSKEDNIPTIKFLGQGKFISRRPTQEEVNLLMRAGFQPAEVTSFKKASINGVNYDCANNKNRRFCNSNINYKPNSFATITNILQFFHDNAMVQGLIIRTFKNVGNAFNTQHIHRITLSNNSEFITEITYLKPAIKIATKNDIYILSLANCWETD